MIKDAMPPGFRRMFPFRSRFMDVGGHRLHYVDEGQGEPVVMLHGNPTWSFYYRHLIRVLSPGYRTIVPDHVGCGLSDKPAPSDYDYTLARRVSDLGHFLSALELKDKITLVVHDWGGMIGMAWAVRNPEKIRRVVILNTAAFFPPGGKTLPFRLRMIRNGAFFLKPAVLGLNLFAGSALYMAPRKPLSRDVKRCLVAPYNSWKNRIATYRFVKDIPTSPSDPAFDTVAATSDNLHLLRKFPVLICWGRHDFVFDLDYLSEWRLRFPEAEVHLLESAGHYLLEDEPEKVASILVDFLKRPIPIKREDTRHV